MRFSLLKISLLAAFVAAPMIARADSIASAVDTFTFTATGYGTTTFTIAASPVVMDNTSYFGVANVTFSGYQAGTGTAYFNNDGDFAFSDGSFPGGYGTPSMLMYSGTTANPTFNTGVYDLSYSTQWSNMYPGTPATLTISSTPEPSSLILLGTGLVGLAGAARRKLRS